MGGANVRVGVDVRIRTGAARWNRFQTRFGRSITWNDGRNGCEGSEPLRSHWQRTVNAGNHDHCRIAVNTCPATLRELGSRGLITVDKPGKLRAMLGADAQGRDQA